MPSSVAVKLPEDGTVRELPSQLPFPLPNPEEHRLEQIDQDEGGLYLDCEINDIRCQALIDTGASLSCVRLDTSPDARTVYFLAEPYNKSLEIEATRTVTTVTGERAQIQGPPGQLGSLCYITVGNKRLCHDFCLAEIQEECIIGLDLLERWGAKVDIPRACLYMDSQTIALQRRSVKKRKSNDGNILPPLEPPAPSPTAAVRQGNATQAQPAAAAPPPVAPQPPVLTSVPPSEDIIEAVVALHQRSKEGLSSKQSHQLQDMLFSLQIRYIFADCTQTKLVQHEMDSDTADAHPIIPVTDWGEEVPFCHSVSGGLL